MNRKRRYDPDAKTDAPYAVIRREWWEDRKRELAAMTRVQLEAALRERKIKTPKVEAGETPRRMLWMRMRLAYAEQNEFAAERGQPVTSLATIAHMDNPPGWLPTWAVNIFYGEAV